MQVLSLLDRSVFIQTPCQCVRYPVREETKDLIRQGEDRLKNRIREKWLSGGRSLGTISHMLSPVAVEALGASGLDFVMLDMEHSPMHSQELAACVTAADAAGITPLVRVGDVSRCSLLRALDVGAMGLIVPGVESVGQVRELVEHAKFQPLGKRGYCMTRDGKWGYGEAYLEGLAGYMRRCNEETLLIPQCETVGCLEHIEEIAALEGVDGILIGPYDLSLAMGIGGQFEHPDFTAAVSRILNACKQNGILSMIFAGTEEDIPSRLDQGFDSILYGLDVLCLIRHYAAVTAKFKRSHRKETDNEIL